MASKNINVELSIYEKLLALKGERESFSQLFDRILREQKNIRSCFGINKKLDFTYQEIKKSRVRDRDVAF